MAILPRSKPGLLLLALLTAAAAALRPFAELGVRLGSCPLPSLPLRWIVVSAALAFFLVSRTLRRPSAHRTIAAALGLALAGSLLSVWRVKMLEPAPGLVAGLSRLSDPHRRIERTISLDTLRLVSRRYLNRLTGRRRDIALDVSGFLFVPRTGVHRFLLECDDTCALGIDGRTLSRATGSASVAASLTSGIHRLDVRYEQGSGPASLRIAWDRPDWLEILPLEHYLSARPDGIDASRLRRIERHAAAWLTSCLIWWALLFGLVLETGRSRQYWRQWLTSPPTAAWVTRAAAAGLVLYGATARFEALLVQSRLAIEKPEAARIHTALRTLLPDYGVFNVQSAPDDPYRADVRSYLDRASSMSPGGFYDPSFREPFYVVLVKLFVWLSGGKEIGVLIQSFVFSVAVLPLVFLVGARLAGPWWGLALLVPVILHEWLILESPSGYRMSAYAFFLVVFVSWVFLREKGSWWLGAAVAGVLGAMVCLIRLSGLSFVLPLLAVRAWEHPKFNGWRYVTLSLLLLFIFIGPFLLNCYVAHGDPFYSVSFHTRFWLDAEEKAIEVEGPVSLFRYFLEFHGLSSLASGSLRGLTVLPMRTFWNGLAHFPWLDVAVLTAGALGLMLALGSRYRFLGVAYFAHLVPFAYIQNFPSGQMPRFVMPAYFFLVFAAGWAVSRTRERPEADSPSLMLPRTGPPW